jgi:hypothetical protein
MEIDLNKITYGQIESEYDMNRPPINLSIFDESIDNIDNPT